jgi:two-component system chemotaxis sensor kinase CheA
VPTVLIVEDEWAIADWLGGLLGDEGYQVVTASDGKQALQLLKNHKPDLVLTDFMMPIMDGPALLAAMRRDGLDGIPVIVMSGLPQASVASRCDGYQAFIRKPFREADLLQTVRRLLDGGVQPG